MGRILMGEKRSGANKVTVPHPRPAGSGIRAGKRDGDLASLRPLSRGIPNPVPRYQVPGREEGVVMVGRCPEP